MKLVILDRDGVINAESDAYIKSASEWRPLAGSLEAIARLHRGGWRVFVATNQSGLARGLFDVATLTAIHARMHREVSALGGAIDGIVYCPHGPDDGCECRKPRAGMYREIAARLGCALAGVPVIGDAARDLDAAAEVGADGILVRTGKGESTLADYPDSVRGAVHDDLAAAADALLNGG